MALQNTLASLTGTDDHRPTNRLRSFRTYGAIATGSAFAIIGASRRNLGGTVLAAAGGYLVYLGFRESQGGFAPVHVNVSVTINKPVEEVYSFWRNFENLPRFMQHLRSVTSTGPRSSHWEARAPLGTSITWDAEITDERENRYLVWNSLDGSLLDHSGAVEFRTAPANRGTEIIVALDMRPPAGKLFAGLAGFFGEHPQQQVKGDLRRLKQLLETGEIATIEGQSSGRRSAFVRMMQAATNAGTTMRDRTAS
jgi:uncharacterized membrane protein